MGWKKAFELGGKGRLLPMEGLRGLAVTMVFFQHYSMQFLEKSDLIGTAKWFASSLRLFGNFGVELFFVMSGYLIYGSLLRRQPRFLAFMARRAERLYPAFLIACSIGAALDLVRPHPKIPPGLTDAALYLGANIVFLPGLFPIEPLFAVNWSLSYEWWFYVACAVLVLAGFNRVSRSWRIAAIVLLGAVLLGLAGVNVAYVPVRGLPLLAGMLLAEASAERRWRVPSWVGLGAFITVFLGYSMRPWSNWEGALLVTLCFTALCAATFQPDSQAAKLFSWRWLRWLGNMSYSFYLMHGFVVVIAAEIALRVFGRAALGVLFWPLMLPIFLLSAMAGGVLFLWVEKPFSLSVPRMVPQRRLEPGQEPTA